MRSLVSAQAPRRQGTTASARKKWLVSFAVMSGTFLAVMDVSVVNVSMPHMMGNFGQTLSAITWVATSYKYCRNAHDHHGGVVQRPDGEKTAVPRVLCPVYAGVDAGGHRPDLHANALLSHPAGPRGRQFDS